MIGRKESEIRAVPWVFAMSLLAACGAPEGPEDAVTALFEALRAGDGAGVVARMSSAAVAEMGDELEALKADPEASAAGLATIGVPIDASELPGMTAEEFAEAIFSSRVVTDIVASGEVTTGNVVVEGDVATVEVTTAVGGRTETHEIEVVREDGVWKVTDFGMGF